MNEEKIKTLYCSNKDCIMREGFMIYEEDVSIFIREGCPHCSKPLMYLKASRCDRGIASLRLVGDK